MTEPKVELLIRPDRAAVSTLLSEAFADDPAYDYFLQGCISAEQDYYRTRLIRFIVDYHCDAGMPVWGMIRHGNLVACALVEEPIPTWRRVLALLRHLPSLVGWVPWGSFQRMNQYARTSRQGLPPSIQYYLVKIGVASNQQGHGLGKTLLKALVAHYCRDDQVLALDTENPDNVPLYQHMGFHLHDEIRLDSLPVYRMYHPAE